VKVMRVGRVTCTTPSPDLHIAATMHLARYARHALKTTLQATISLCREIFCSAGKTAVEA
jgi:hypothetical protein